MQAHTDALLHAYAAFNRRDIDAVLALMTEDVDWPDATEGIRVLGCDAVRAYWTKQWSAVDPHVEPVGFEADRDGKIVVHVHQVVRNLDGSILADRRVRHVYSFKDGLIARMEIGES